MQRLRVEVDHFVELATKQHQDPLRRRQCQQLFFNAGLKSAKTGAEFTAFFKRPKHCSCVSSHLKS